MIEAWSRIMQAVPDSHFLFVRLQADSMAFRTNMIREFGKHDIEPDRLLFYDNVSRNIPHLACYNEIDISLDTFPVTGGTTTCDALWMGVPVVTLVGEGPHQRLSHSLLCTVELEDLCAYDIESYIEKAIALANDHEPLAFLRQHLRPAIENSILCDGERFSKNFFDALLGVAKAHDLA